ncbi:hypothetical protein EV189_3869 [Motilibacter rhizosphaerae]|uniref:Uncharacterized protein n=1 Tax=Motilibacter rhizosphaerae TaxID=598652 RepID=A0A4Q7NA76_9ACTN|nr:hypothetical protein [Motilibacter rhizosphaerae]RZS78999.1 hypothetical protein EV189_3869 [Motilibacter rhizosphaerae]
MPRRPLLLLAAASAALLVLDRLHGPSGCLRGPLDWWTTGALLAALALAVAPGRAAPLRAGLGAVLVLVAVVAPRPSRSSSHGVDFVFCSDAVPTGLAPAGRAAAYAVLDAGAPLAVVTVLLVLLGPLLRRPGPAAAVPLLLLACFPWWGSGAWGVNGRWLWQASPAWTAAVVLTAAVLLLGAWRPRVERAGAVLAAVLLALGWGVAAVGGLHAAYTSDGDLGSTWISTWIPDIGVGPTWAAFAGSALVIASLARPLRGASTGEGQQTA